MIAKVPRFALNLLAVELKKNNNNNNKNNLEFSALVSCQPACELNIE